MPLNLAVSSLRPQRFFDVRGWSASPTAQSPNTFVAQIVLKPLRPEPENPQWGEHTLLYRRGDTPFDLPFDLDSASSHL